MKKITLVVLCYDGMDTLPTVLQSIREQTYKDYELLVVDNGSTDGTSEWLKKSGVPHVSISPNRGFSGGINVGLRQARTPYVATINDDAKLAPTCIEELMNVIETDARISCVQPKIVTAEGDKLESAGLKITYGGFIATEGKGLQPDAYAEQRDIIGVHAAVAVFRTDALERVGYFDEGFIPVYYEDADLSFKITKAGYRIVYCPSALAYHRSGFTIKRKMGYDASISWHRNRYRMMRKHWMWAKWAKALLYAPFVTGFYILRRDRAYFQSTSEFLKAVTRDFVSSAKMRTATNLRSLDGPAKKVLIVGSGPGDLVRHFRNATGVDADELYVYLAAKRFKRAFVTPDKLKGMFDIAIVNTERSTPQLLALAKKHAKKVYNWNGSKPSPV
ncbi:MAG: glycosyltransferase family 2 protein [Candidatus Aenigmarchaeota archaeon]|nr:glycosyltransferase family 2 protein [Candidatus Aenigmarchaeota archaeon]